MATKYLSLAARHFARKGVPAEIIPLHGSIEVAPSLGLADVIVDITETGETLKANGLVIEEKVLEVSARLVVNRVALKLHAERLRRLIAGPPGGRRRGHRPRIAVERRRRFCLVFPRLPLPSGARLTPRP